MANHDTREKIKVAGFIRNSFVDFPGEIAFVIFLGGCNFSCPHCHNRRICYPESNIVPLAEVLGELREQIGFVDGVVISGGEPTEHPNLREIIDAVRTFRVKLDTNGSNFDVLRELVDDGVVDYVAMDIKAPIEKYVKLGFCRPDAIENVRKSIEFLKTQTRVPVMFRTTPVPELSADDMDAIRKLAGAPQSMGGKPVVKCSDNVVYRVNDYIDV